MNMIHRFMGCIREYKKPTILTLLCMVGEVAIEVLIPFFTANLVNEIKGGAELSGVVRVGLGLILMSLVSLGCGALFLEKRPIVMLLCFVLSTQYSGIGGGWQE